MVIRAFASIALVFLPFSATAQITLAPDDLRLPLGIAWEQEIATAQVSLAASEFNIGSAGADQSFDLTGGLAHSTSIRARSLVIPLEQAPDAARFPDADYAVHNITTVPNATGEIEVYTYMQRSANGDVPVGTEGPAGQVPVPFFDAGIPWPLEFGKHWTVENLSLDQTIAPGITSSGLYDYQYVVDAWGEIRLPAGTFECLRVHQTGSGVVTFTGDAHLASLGEVTVEIDAYAWSVRGLGAVAMVVETRQTFARGDISPTTTTQVIRLTEVSSPASAVAATSWGAFKQTFAE